ncbi:transposase [Cyanobium sp. Morenito 9A2]|uniref:transposase n=1 Tax=Cyanobium sp. Morenito 9A2 TaxID=2823718 RepID=UPI0029F030CE|nr:transposase [Cyanobium sp. Morenito 9A2]
MLVLQQLFNLSDKVLELQVNDRRSFVGFVCLGMMNSIPDATTVAFFRVGSVRLVSSITNSNGLRSTPALRGLRHAVSRWLSHAHACALAARLLRSSNIENQGKTTHPSTAVRSQTDGLKS